VRVVWTRKARRGIDDLHAHIAKDSPINADGFVERILDAVATLADTPRIGKVLPEAGGDELVRQRIVQSQRVIYEIDDERQVVSILALVHVRRDLATLRRKPWE